MVKEAAFVGGHEINPEFPGKCNENPVNNLISHE